MIDGAHAVGAMPLNVPSLGGHFYTSNLHKWHCTAKASAFLWVAPSKQQHMVPLVTSHGYGLVRFRDCTAASSALRTLCWVGECLLNIGYRGFCQKAAAYAAHHQNCRYQPSLRCPAGLVSSHEVVCGSSLFCTY